MNYAAREEKLAAWLEAERAMRSRLAPTGTVPLREVAQMHPHAFFDGIGKGELPRPPIASCWASSPSNGRPAISCSRARRTRRTTTR